nr:DUF1612 domain-containing protein [Methylobacterium ajmalii]
MGQGARTRPQHPPCHPSTPQRGEGDLPEVDDAFSAELADIDALIARFSRILADTGSVREKSSLVYDPAWGESDRLAAWRQTVTDTRILPPVLDATIAVDAWTALEPLQHRAWLGPLLAAELLRARDKAQYHLPALASSLRRVPGDRWLVRDPLTRWLEVLGAVALGAEQGMRDHDRGMLARERLLRPRTRSPPTRCRDARAREAAAQSAGKRGSSSLPRLIEIVLARPLVSATIIAEELGVSPRAPPRPSWPSSACANSPVENASALGGSCKLLALSGSEIMGALSPKMGSARW